MSDKTDALARRGFLLWLNWKLLPKDSEEYLKIEKTLKERYKTDSLNPLLEILGLIEWTFVEDSLKGKDYFSEEEKSLVVNDVLAQLAELFPEVAEKLDKLAKALEGDLRSLRVFIEKYLSEKS